MTLKGMKRWRGLNIVVGMLTVLNLFACDSEQQDKQLVPVTLEIDVGWIVQNELENLAQTV